VTAETVADPPFWSDDFDMDLPKVIPEAKERLGEIAGLEIVTHGHMTHGRLNHPTCWNHSLGLVSFFGRGHPHKDESYWTSDPLVPCTLWEAVRDAWSHNNVIVFEHNPVFHGDHMWQYFEPLMYHLRGWDSKLTEKQVKEMKLCVLDEIAQCRMLIRAQIDRKGRHAFE